jgi:hypothetical protein
MDEQEWLTCVDPTAMLEFFRHVDRASERKLRMFAAGCCRRVWHLLGDERSQGAVEVLERWLDGTASSRELEVAHASAWEVWGTPARTAASDATAPGCNIDVAINAASHAAWAYSAGSRADERKAQAALLRCIFGPLPFRPPSPLAPSVLAWNNSILTRLASRIYDEQRWEDLPILADALEDAGSDNADLLSHLRGPGPHVRGCWALDLILDRK